MKASYDITGMSCASCSASVERAMKSLGAENVSVNLLSGVMKVEYDERKFSDSDIRNAVKGAGFGIETAKSPAEKRLENELRAIKAQNSLMRRFIVSLIFLLPLMYVSMGHMWGLPLPGILTEKPVLFAVLQLILTLPVLIINRVYYVNGFRHLFARTPNMDSLIAVGTTAPVIYGLFAIVMIALGNTHYMHDLYFETASMILTLVTLGKYLEGRSKTGTGKALSMLIDLTPKKAIVIRNGTETEIDAGDIKPDDILSVKPGQSFACDGKVMGGETYVDEASLTGESMPVFKQKGDLVRAGTLNKNGAVSVRAEQVGDETVISRIVRLVEDASGTKAPISRLADKISGVFVPIVIGISLLTAVVWLICGAEFEFAFSRAICVLVISCPCALGLATPVAVTVGTGVAAQNGILIKSAETLEHMGKIDTVLFDKTGTLTNGEPVVTDILPKGGLDETSLLTLAASAEKPSEHPLATAIVKNAADKGLVLYDTSSFSAVPGKGLTAVIGEKKVTAGNPSLFEEQGIELSDSEKEQYKRLCTEGKTPLCFAENESYVGMIAVADTPKDDSRAAVEKLHELGIDSVMLTGDNEITAKAVAKSLGITNVCAGVMPEQKEETVRKYQSAGHKVAMIGDGINDSPALARADVGFSVSKGTDIALETADVVLMHSDVYSLPRAIALSRKTISNIKLSLFWALFYNTLGIPVAAGVFFPLFNLTLSPMIGAAAMSLSSICVVTNALRLRNFKFN